MLSLMLRFLIQNLQWVLLVFAPYILAATCVPPPDTGNGNSNANTNNNNGIDPNDLDSDGVLDVEDNCPGLANPNQGDIDEDGVGNSCDNCPDDENADQVDTDEDGFGDPCDNCPELANEDQADTDEDGIGDACESEFGTVSGRVTPVDDVTAASVLRNNRRRINFAANAYEHVPDELLVVFEDDVTEWRCHELQAERGLDLIKMSPSGIHRYRCANRYAAMTPQKRWLTLLHEAKMLQALPEVRIAEPNFIRHVQRVPNDPRYERQEWHYSAINLPDAWDVTVGDESIIIAMVDTGILVDHPEFEGRLVPGYDFISDPFTANDDDNGGFTDVDPIDGEDDSDIDDDPNDPGDSLFGNSTFHGSHTAGTVGALTDNGDGVAGVTWNCKIMPIRGLGVGGGTVADLVEGMRYAGGLDNISGLVPDEPADVVNLSLGGSAGEAESQIERAAIQELVANGVTVVAASGNQGSALPAPPASYPESISVGAVDASLERANYSNYGSTLDVVAPGGDISADENNDGFPDGVYSTVGDDSGDSIEFTYTFFEGTSMACPHVSGVIGLMLSANPDLTPGEIRQILTSTATDLGEPGWDEEYGHGLINALAAVQAAQSGEIPDVPILGLSTNALDFGIEDDVQEVTVTNLGGGMLNITDLAIETDDGGDWLSASLSGSSETSNATAIEVEVERIGLDPGSYSGTITVTAEGLPDQTISVNIEVEALAFMGTIIVEAFDPESFVTVKSTETTDAVRFEYVLEDLPPGNYLIFAGTDLDGDGEICELGDLCGSYDDMITVVAGEENTEINFTAALINN